MNPPNSFRPGFYKLAHSRRFRKIDNLSYIYRRPTKKILLPNIFERPTRIIEIVYTRTIEVTADSIFRRPTRRIAVRNVFQRPTRKIPMPNIYSRPTRPIRRPFDCNNNITGEVPGADHAIQVQANAFNIRPCSIVLEWLNPELVQRHASNIANGNHGFVDNSTAVIAARTISYIDLRSDTHRPIQLEAKIFYELYDRNQQFAIDDFGGGKHVMHYFLTRFHPDQYAGLTGKFTRYIYASRTTAYLVQKILKVDGALLRILNPDVPVIVDGVEITAISVPSYPGALMILFKSRSGQVELHGGYMSTSAELEENLTMWNEKIDAVVFYNDHQISSFNDGHWDEAKCRIEMSEIIDKFQERQRCKGLAGLIVFNSRKSSYSMEKLYTSFASLYGLTIWADDESRVLIEGLEMEDGNVTHLIASKPEEAAIHILSGNKCQKENLLEYLSHMNAYHMIVFQVCADDSPHVSLQRPAYDVFPLKIYNIRNAFIPQVSEYQRFIQYAKSKSSLDTEDSYCRDFTELTVS